MGKGEKKCEADRSGVENSSCELKCLMMPRVFCRSTDKGQRSLNFDLSNKSFVKFVDHNCRCGRKDFSDENLRSVGSLSEASLYFGSKDFMRRVLVHMMPQLDSQKAFEK
jgi:hypothetical protein